MVFKSSQPRSQKVKIEKTINKAKGINFPSSTHLNQGIRNFLKFIFSPKYSGLAEKLRTKLAQRKKTGMGRIIHSRLLFWKSAFLILANLKVII